MINDLSFRPLSRNPGLTDKLLILMNILELQHASVQYGGVHALQDVSVELRPGEMVALMGPNGAGKSTVLKAIFGLTSLHSGRVLWHGTHIVPVTHHMVARGVAFVPQGRRVFTHLTVEQNLEVAGEVVPKDCSVQERIEEVMQFFPELKKKRRAQSGTLSGGQQQMLALGRGLMSEPDVLLLDEPSLGLAPKIVTEVFAKIKEINQQKGMAIMIVEHNLKSLLEVVDRAYVLDKGALVLEETAENLKKGTTLEHILLGRM